MADFQKLKIGALLFDNFELLDFFGPLEMFGLLKEQANISVLAEQAGSIESSAGPSAIADINFAQATSYDVLLIPGGIGTRRLANDQKFLTELAQLAENSGLVATVCTGSFLLARTGLLNGKNATTNKRVFTQAVNFGPDVNWIAKARWVEDDKYFTSSGISAGMDMTLAIIAKLLGRETALQIASHAEYDWHQDSTWDPFAEENGLS